jgi:hypothetical protein
MFMHAGNGKGSTKLRRAIAWAAALGVVVGITVGAWAMWRSHNKQKLLASIKDDPRKVREAVRDGQITRDDARDVMMDAFEARMNKTVDDYFALDQKDRDKYLDKLIDEQEAMRRQWQQRATTRPTSRPAREDRPATTRPAGDMQQRMRERADRTPPERTARRAEFMAAMMQRRAARGLTGGPGGGGWGGGRGGGGGGRGSR